ncbi:hypothetical protein PAPHI01_0015 [Pancytospora philotis]|nr:hypothetical protein PAPHI01_0015 [Pancytospora philotis]
MFTLPSTIELILMAVSASAAAAGAGDVENSIENDARCYLNGTKNDRLVIGLKLSNDLSKKTALPSESCFASGRLFKNMSNIVYDTGCYRRIASNEPQRKAICARIYRAAVACNASLFDLVAFTALAMHHHNYFLAHAKAEEKNNEDGSKRGLLGVFGYSEFTDEYSKMSPEGFVGCELHGNRTNECLLNEFCAVSIQVEFSLFMKKLEPIADSKTFRSVIERLGTDDGVALMNNSAMSEEMCGIIERKFYFFSSLAAPMFTRRYY